MQIAVTSDMQFSMLDGDRVRCTVLIAVKSNGRDFDCGVRILGRSHEHPSTFLTPSLQPPFGSPGPTNQHVSLNP